MNNNIFEGKKHALKFKKHIEKELFLLQKKHIRKPKLVSIISNYDKSSIIYDRQQEKICTNTGIIYERLEITKHTKYSDLKKSIDSLNKDASVDGIFLHKPLPEGLLYNEIVELIDEKKDVECEHPFNLGRLFNSNKSPELIPPTPAAVMYAIGSFKKDIYGKQAVIVGHSRIVGKPTAFLLLNKFTTVTSAHIATFESKKLSYYIKEADIVVSAVGKPGLIKSEWIKNSAMVIDVGTAVTKEGIKGDVEFEKIKEKVSFITPVPGGIGPLTVVFLIKNLIFLYKNNLRNVKQ